MTLEELEEWQEAFEQFHARFADLYARQESREQAKKYMRGLLANVERKNSWQLAEHARETRPDRMQRLLSSTVWDVNGVCDDVLDYVVERLGKRKLI
jgi:SRSO17 transposase